MKKVIVYLFVAIAILLLIVALKLLNGYFFEKVNTHGLTEISPKVDVLIIDMPNRTPEELRQDLNNGKAELLLWIEDDHGEKQAYVFNTLESLVRLGKNSTNSLSSDSPNLKGLNLARYDDANKVLYYVPIKAGKIVSIEVSRSYLIGEVLSDPKNYQISAGTVLLTDGTEKELRMVKVPEAQIEQAKLRLYKPTSAQQQEKK